MKNRHVLIGAVLAAILACTFSSCTKSGLGTSRLSLYLTDAPAAYDAVNIEILRIEIKSTNDFGDDSWQVLRFNNPGIYNLLDYTNGLDTLLSSAELPTGKLSQIRLMLGTNNSIVVNGTTMELPLTTPSMQQTGLKLNVHADLLEGVEYKLWIDFDCARSIVLTGNGEYKLKPVLRTFTQAETGAIQGVIQPLAADATVFAIAGVDTVSAIPNNVTGHFLIRGLAPGTWKLVADGNNGYQDQTLENIPVKIGEITSANTITLTQ
ncbi:MAG TPA: DUF4382 domain-containing protein [Chitinophagaceae bacterium]